MASEPLELELLWEVLSSIPSTKQGYLCVAHTQELQKQFRFTVTAVASGQGVAGTAVCSRAARLSVLRALLGCHTSSSSQTWTVTG